jgi:AcrR family transcriptional regulator
MTTRGAPVDRAQLIADTAITVLAERGMRGLTHRAVDERAGLPSGSTSNHARTRAALLDAAMTRMIELEAATSGGLAGPGAAGAPDAPAALPPLTVDMLADAIAGMLHHQLHAGRTQLLARHEFALEATRRPELRAIYDRAGRSFREPAAALLAALGSPAPARHGRMLIAWCEGVLFDSTAGAGWAHPPDRDELRADVADLLHVMCGAQGTVTTDG